MSNEQESWLKVHSLQELHGLVPTPGDLQVLGLPASTDKVNHLALSLRFIDGEALKGGCLAQGHPTSREEKADLLTQMNHISFLTCGWL